MRHKADSRTDIAVLTERTKSCLLTHTLGPRVITAPRNAEATWLNRVRVLAAADALAACVDADQMLRRTVEVEGECIGLERRAHRRAFVHYEYEPDDYEKLRR